MATDSSARRRTQRSLTPAHDDGEAIDTLPLRNSWVIEQSPLRLAARICEESVGMMGLLTRLNPSCRDPLLA